MHFCKTFFNRCAVCFFLGFEFSFFHKGFMCHRQRGVHQLTDAENAIFASRFDVDARIGLDNIRLDESQLNAVVVRNQRQRYSDCLFNRVVITNRRSANHNRHWNTRRYAKSFY